MALNGSKVPNYNVQVMKVKNEAHLRHHLVNYLQPLVESWSGQRCTKRERERVYVVKLITSCTTIPHMLNSSFISDTKYILNMKKVNEILFCGEYLTSNFKCQHECKEDILKKFTLLQDHQGSKCHHFLSFNFCFCVQKS